MYCKAIFLLLLSFSTKGYSLQCYSSKFVVKSKIIHNITHEVKDCVEYINDIRRSQGKPEGHLLTTELRCWTATLIADYKKFVIKGCVAKGGCKVLNTIFEKMIDSSSSSVKCVECEGDECNGTSKMQIFWLGFLLTVIILEL